MLLHLSTWPEVEDYLRTSHGIIVPIGSTEQHGPNGMIGTDAICAEVIAKAVGESVNALVAPTINVGMAVHHMAFAGSMTLQPSTLMAVVSDWVDSLARHGFRRFFFINGHGGNIHTLGTAFSQINHTRAVTGTEGVRCHVASWWENDGVARLSRELFGSAEGAHATPSEVSLTQFAYPEAIRTMELPPAQPGSGFYGPEDYRRRYPDGRIASDPTLARPEHGERLLKAAVTALAGRYQRFMEEA